MRGGASVCMERGISARRRYAALRVARTGALDERGHGGGDHPVPFRTRQLSPPSPDVLRGKPVGGRAAALAQRARACAPAHRRPRPARGPLLSRPCVPTLFPGPRFRNADTLHAASRHCRRDRAEGGVASPRHSFGRLLRHLPIRYPVEAGESESFILRFRRMDVRIFSRHTAVFLVVFRTLPSRAGKLSHCM